MLEKINHQPARKELRNFGFVLLVGFGVIGFLLRRHGKLDLALGLWSGSAAIAFLSFAAPALARPFYVLWMTIGVAIGFVTSRVVMTVIFYAVISPVAFFFRLSGRDALRLKKSLKGNSTHWSPHPKIEIKSYDHLF